MSSLTISQSLAIPQTGILGTDFLKDNAPTDIWYDVQEFVKWHVITISCTRQDAILIPARTANIFYIKIKNPEVNTEIVLRLHLGNCLYAGNALVKNHGGIAYIKIINMRDTDIESLSLKSN